jgi:predicted nuclease with TOPRIM domain
MSLRKLALSKKSEELRKEIEELQEKLEERSAKLERYENLKDADIGDLEFNTSPETDIYRLKAKEDWASSDLEFDAYPSVADIPGSGAWVQCWVYVHKPTEEERKKLCSDTQSSEF